MEKIIQVYKDDPKNLFCLDECTGLQVLERIAPDLPANSKRVMHQEFEYKRHGTVSIISIMEKQSGRVFTECIPDHTSVTIIESVKRHASLYDPAEKLHYICDNYSSHSSEEFCKGIAELCRVRLPELKTANARKRWLESDDKRIVFYFLPTHGSWLNLIEIWFSILKQKALSGKSTASKSQMEKSILDFTETWNMHFAHPFKWSYDGQDLYEKVILRLIKWLELETPQMTAHFLEKQLKLMENLAAKHSCKVKRAIWIRLQKTLEDKMNFVCKIVDSIDPENKNSGRQQDNIRSLYFYLTDQKTLCRKAA
jgi:transposase